MLKSKEEKVCKICIKKILNKDDYVRLTEYKLGKESSTAYYHTQCFRTRFMNFQKIQKQAQAIFTKAAPLLEQFNVIREEN